MSNTLNSFIPIEIKTDKEGVVVLRIKEISIDQRPRERLKSKGILEANTYRTFVCFS